MYDIILYHIIVYCVIDYIRFITCGRRLTAWSTSWTCSQFCILRTSARSTTQTCYY